MVLVRWSKGNGAGVLAGAVGLAQGEVVGFGEGSHEIASRCRLVRLSPMVLTSRGPR